MEIDQSQIDELVRNPSESLNVEVKNWLDLSTAEGQAKLVRACLALRNRDGGFLIMGFDDKTLQPAPNRPDDVRAEFHVDVVQPLVARHAYDVFEVGVAFSSRGGVEYPVLVVGSGVKSPVAAKSDLLDSKGAKKLVSVGDVYFRTLNSSRVPATSPARPADWRDIIEICSANREGDIGGFFRRQIVGTSREVLVGALKELGVAMFVDRATSAAMPSLCDQARAMLIKGAERFAANVSNRSPSSALLDALSWEVSLVVDPGWPSRLADKNFLAEVVGSNPNYTGWPVWLDSRTFRDSQSRPVVVDRAWEAFIVAEDGWSRHLDFMRFDPAGKFYLRRALQDDLTDKVAPGTVLDPVLVLYRVAEAIAVGLAFVHALDSSADIPRRLAFAFRWTGLANRVLSTWANPMRMMLGRPQSHEDVVTTCVEMPSDTSVKAIAPFVEEATRELFAAFDGEIIPSPVIEDLTSRVVERRIGS